MGPGPAGNETRLLDKLTSIVTLSLLPAARESS